MKAKKIILPFLFCATVVCADTITVTSLDDSGSGTLRDAIMNAQNGDTIDFDSSLSGTILLESALPTITLDDITILGPSDNSITIDGNSQYRIFTVQANPFKASNLNFNHGADAAKGGAVFVNSGYYANLTDVVITPAAGSVGENALYVDTSGVLDITDVTFTSADSSQAYLNAGSLNIKSNVPLEYIVDGVGGGQISKFGDSSATVSPPPSVTVDYYLIASNGSLSFTGSSVDSAVVLSSGELQGNFEVSDVANLGSLMPGDASSFGTINFTGDYISVGGETKIKVDPSSSSDLVFAGGNIYLFFSALTIVPASGTYTQGTVFTILTTDGGANGTFDTVSLGGLDAQVNYNANSIEIEILNDTTI
ncbi:MAG: hypothetical protein K2P51_07735 [Rhabdochlamydiaceae bacterium]|nr:hypothetical protein [Rhabdochlamydiaceae bacterium]